MKIAEILQYPGRQVSDTIDLCDTTNLLLEIEDYVVTEGVLENIIRILRYYNNPNSESRIFWIEGEFGVGKSYFLKILSTLLENKEVQGKYSSSAILSKIEDKELGQELKSAYQHPSESVCLNLAKEFGFTTSLIEVFYSHFSRHIDVSKETFIEKNNQHNRFTKIKESPQYSLKGLIELVKSYLKKKEKGLRLNLFIDSVEILQQREGFELSSIIETLVLETTGKISVFLASTAPIANSELDNLKRKSNFHFHLSVQEDARIIQHKLLAKSNEQKKILTPFYDQFSKLFRTPVINYFDPAPLSFNLFSDYYPFLPYQIHLYKDSKASLHMNASNVFEYQPKYNSFAAREILRVYTNILKKVSEGPLNKIVSFDYFFDELTHLKEESHIKKHIRINEIKFPLEMRILKVLFMTQFSTHFQSTVENIARLLIDDLQIDWEEHYKTVENGLKQLSKKEVVNYNRDRCFYSPLSNQTATRLENP